ncbi:MAG TPA: carboxylesterase family protein, partial [Opitutaceae bacterium]
MTIHAPSFATALRPLALAAALTACAGSLVPSAAIAAAGTPPAASAVAVAATGAGRVRGYVDAGILAFKGIPYGTDTATTRFRAPRPPEPWEDIRDATRFGPQAPQPAGRRSAAADPAPAIVESEDCLRLNVWTPALRDGGRRPVLVYFHGGAYNSGTVTEDLYDGVRLCRRGNVVVVTVYHRLNGFGFLYLAEIDGDGRFARSGNAGMLDLVLALQWVRDNISGFGGDPGNDTIFGQSGDGAKYAVLMAMPAARGLFHRVWTMSGQQIAGRDAARATETARAVLEQLGITPGQLDRLDTIPRERLAGAKRGGDWTPVMDGRALPRHPFQPDSSPLSHDIPVVMGNTRDETRNLIGGRDPALFELTWEDLPATIERNVRQFIGEMQSGDIVSSYRRMYSEYSLSDVFFAATIA